MPTNYPAALDSFTTKVDGVDDVLAADINKLQDAVLALQTKLGAHGQDLLMRAASGADPGDILFLSSGGAEIGRISRDAWSPNFLVRFSGSDAAKVLAHSENAYQFNAIAPIGSIGSYAFMYSSAVVSPGVLVNGSSIVYAGVGGVGYNPAGTWRCMGYSWGNDRTLFLRVA